MVPDLDKLAPKLWLISTPVSSHISPLHHQAVRGRSIVVAENPQLHLVWAYSQIYIKPIPRYLLSRAFWEYLGRGATVGRQNEEIWKAAAGFIRTYSFLIRHESDFRLARREEYCLIPADDGTDLITWERFAAFIASFEDMNDELVCPRYSYGELRLTRLNFYTRLFLRKLAFHHLEAQWGALLGGYITPLLSLFAIFSVVLNAMQVGLAVPAVSSGSDGWSAFLSVARWFSVVTLLLVMFALVLLAIFVVWMFAHDIWFARRTIQRKERHQSMGWRYDKSGVI
ncbi:MAG: hypothetical protein M1838_000863 [Thelocarpon superellum]|nr:MAG: hypothetical protein M1838_000863 [Thelocarpon superellum]